MRPCGTRPRAPRCWCSPGKEYGSGSSRDWAAKGPALQGIRAVIAESYERIHRSNLVGMGILPLQFAAGESADTLGLTGREFFDFEGLAAGDRDRVCRRAGRSRSGLGGRTAPQLSFSATIRIDTPQEVLYYQHGGILPYVLRQLLSVGRSPRPSEGLPRTRRPRNRLQLRARWRRARSSRSRPAIRRRIERCQDRASVCGGYVARSEAL